MRGGPPDLSGTTELKPAIGRVRWGMGYKAIILASEQQYISMLCLENLLEL